MGGIQTFGFSFGVSILTGDGDATRFYSGYGGFTLIVGFLMCYFYRYYIGAFFISGSLIVIMGLILGLTYFGFFISGTGLSSNPTPIGIPSLSFHQ